MKRRKGDRQGRGEREGERKGCFFTSVLPKLMKLHSLLKRLHRNPMPQEETFWSNIFSFLENHVTVNEATCRMKSWRERRGISYYRNLTLKLYTHVRLCMYIPETINLSGEGNAAPNLFV